MNVFDCTVHSSCFVRRATPHEITRARKRGGFTRTFTRTFAIADRPIVARAARQ